jgi:hypothetical protein
MARNKLSQAAQRLVVERITAGDTNNQIRQELKKASFPHDLSDPSISHYRALPEVLEAITRKEEQAIQSGLSQKSERLLKLAALAKAIEGELFADDGRRFKDMEKLDKVRLAREYRAALDDIGALVDPRKPITLQNVNMGNFTDEQLEQLRRGVPIEVILATASGGGNGAAPSGGKE